jgi:glucokinase
LGHTVIDRRADARGEPSTVEALGSGTALTRLAAEAGLPGGAAFIEVLRAGEPRAVAVWAEVTEALAIGVTNLAFLASPEVIVIGGGLGRVGELLLGPIRDRLARRGPPGLPSPIRVVGAALGDDAGLIGAAAWERAVAGR